MLVQWLVSYAIWITGLQAARILSYDTLDPKKPTYPVLVLNPPRPCSHYNETLYDWKQASQDARTKLRKVLQCSDALTSRYYYVASPDPKKCMVYDIENNCIKKAKCKKNYPSLCTNSAPSRTYDRAPSNDDQWRHVVRSSYGRIQGTRTDIVFTFLGIPYALPPVGELRFQEPKCISRIGIKWDATMYRSYCPQGESVAYGKTVINEDCLYLNVFTPYIPDGADTKKMLLPVLVWIHGGAYIRGMVSFAFHDPSHLAAHEQVVVVTFNYRLGALGFWGGGNQALRDKITVLEWVKEHIQSFGGDPNRVTISGESAGASAVKALLSAKSKTEGLFSSAIMASEVASLGYMSLEDNKNYLSLMLAKEVGCANDLQTIDDDDVMRCMRMVPANAIVEVQEKVGSVASQQNRNINYLQSYNPVIDGELIKEDFYKSLLTGNFVKVPVMYGFLQDEGHFFVPFFFPMPVTKNFFLAILKQMFPDVIGEQVLKSGLYDYYREDQGTDNVRHAMAKVLTDYVWTCPSKFVISKLSKHTTVYAYYYRYAYLWEHPVGSLCYNRSCHADDLVALLANIAIPGMNYLYGSNNTDVSERDLIFTRMFVSRIGSFMKTGNPNPRVEDLCYTSKYFEGFDKQTLQWDSFKAEELAAIKGKQGKEISLKLYGSLHVLDLPEGRTPLYGVNKTACDFWYSLGLYTGMYFEEKDVYLRKRMNRMLRAYGYHY